MTDPTQDPLAQSEEGMQPFSTPELKMLAELVESPTMGALRKLINRDLHLAMRAVMNRNLSIEDIRYEQGRENALRLLLSNLEQGVIPAYQRRVKKEAPREA